MNSFQDLSLRINFIKQVIPFAELPLSKISWLAEQLTEKTLEANTIIFREGERGDECFLIASGKVEVLINSADGEKRIATLEPPMLFGERALLLDAPRNATIRTLETSKFLILKREHLLELMQHHVETAELIMMLSVKHSRPLRYSHITHHEGSVKEGRQMTILKDTKHYRYFELSPYGWFIWQKLDGHHTLQQITLDLFKHYQIFSPEMVASTIFDLAEAGFIDLPELKSLPTPPPPIASRWKKIKYYAKRLCFLHYTFKNMDRFITKTYKPFFYLLFTRIGKYVCAGVLCLGVIAFGLYMDRAIALIPQITNPLAFIIMLGLANLLLTIVHELSHAYATKSYKRDVNRAGVIFYWLGLTAFVDTSDMWLGTKRMRVIVNLAGPYVDILIASAMSLLLSFLFPSLSVFCWLLALLLYCNAFKNLNPIREGDGYQALSDLLGTTNLRRRSLKWIQSFNFKKIKNIKLRPEFIYWVTCFSFFSMALVFSLGLRHYLVMLLPDTLYGISVGHLLWLLPILVVVNFIVLGLKRF